jgi:uncharacterized membrane protein
MDANLDSKTVARNLWQDSMRDGLMEMLLGAYFLLTGICIQADMTALFIVFIAFFPALAKKMKERFTYPRIGYMRFPDRDSNPGRRIVAALLAAGIAVALVTALARSGEWTQTLYKWVPLIPALLLAAGFSFTAQKTGFARHYVMAVFSLVAGFAVPFVDLPGKLDNVALYLFVTGPVFLVWGAAIFVRFMRTYPIRAEETQ